MVQRKVPSKLGIQADHVKSEKLLGNLKPTSFQQDGKNRGPDMKKKMKRSRSIKLSDIESLKSTPLRKPISQPGKPPPLNVSNSAPPALQKQSMVRTSTDGSPNYMKSTSSSEARKERSPVSSSFTPAGSDRNHLHRRNSRSSKVNSASCNKPTKTLTRSSSLKKVRTLTKSPSFKPARGTGKKCSPVAFCADMDVQKATCSSTLKDSKFPDYLMLNPGGTEAEGTSVRKVCPYTYCSLNGHRHTPLPPLKCFLKARRRSLKTQKSTKLECLSPRRAKLFDDAMEEMDDGLLGFPADHKPTMEDMQMPGLVKISMIHEVGTDFFVEIYAKNIEETPEGTVQNMAREAEEQSDGSSDDDEVASEQNNEEVVNSLPDESQHSHVDFEEKFEQNSDGISTDMDSGGVFIEEQQVRDVDEQEQPFLPTEAAASSGSFNNGSDIEDNHSSTGDFDNGSEVTDMEWEDGQFSSPEDDMEAYHLDNHDHDSLTMEYLSGIKKLDSHDGIDIFGSDDMVSNCTEEILVDEVLKELFEETASNTECNDSEPEMDDGTQNSEISEQGQFSSIADAPEQEISNGGEGEEAEIYLNNTVMMSNLIKEPFRGSPALDENVETVSNIFQANPQLEDAENDCSDSTDEALNGHKKGRCPQAGDAALKLQNQICDSSQESLEIGLVGTNDVFEKNCKLEDDGINQNLAIATAIIQQELPTNSTRLLSDSLGSFLEDQDGEVNYIQNYISTGACETDDTAEDSHSSQNLLDESTTTEPPNHQHEESHDEDNKFSYSTSKESEEQGDSSIYEICLKGNVSVEAEKMQLLEEDHIEPDLAETFFATNTGSRRGSDCLFMRARRNDNQVPSTCNNRKWTIGHKKPVNDLEEEERKFNPKEPNFLPIVPEPDAEKVDLKHQMMDDRKNAEEWMIDYALQRAVNKLAPARKRKVALLVEAFETVSPMSKFETHIRHASTPFSPRTIQACN